MTPQAVLAGCAVVAVLGALVCATEKPGLSVGWGLLACGCLWALVAV